MELLTAAQMRAIETEAIEAGRVTGLDLMERAGQGVVEAILEQWPDLATGDRCAIVFCGPGNNGGDGFVVARLLHQRGWQVEVFLYGDPDRLPPDAKANHARWLEIGEVGRVLEDVGRRSDWHGATLVVDALFGTGLTRPLDDLTRVLCDLDDAARSFGDPARRSGAEVPGPRVVAVDIPSGIHTDTGLALEPAHKGHAAASANLTVTFHKPKRGHFHGDGPAACGRLVVRDIGL